MLLLESAINRYLALDPEMLDKLSAFSGKVIKLQITVINRTLYLFPDANGIHIKTEYDGEADTTLTGSPFALFKMGLVSNTADMLLKGEVEISGNTRLGHQFKNTLSQIDIDWAEPLSGLVGDNIAWQLQQAVGKLGLWGKNSLASVSTSASEYLQEESRDVVSQTELEMFNDAVDKLRNDVDRLQARIKSLSKHL